MADSGRTNLLARVLIMAMVPAASAVSGAEPTYVAELDRIKPSFGPRANARWPPGHLGNVCVAEARAVRRIAKAELEARGKGTPKSWYDARIARAEAEFEVAKERCGERSGDRASSASPKRARRKRAPKRTRGRRDPKPRPATGRTPQENERRLAKMKRIAPTLRSQQGKWGYILACWCWACRSRRCAVPRLPPARL